MQLEGAEPDLEYALPAIVVPIVARITGDTERFDAAEEAAKMVLSQPSTTPSLALLARLGLAVIGVARGDGQGAAEQYDALEGYGSTVLYGGFASVDRLLGLICSAIGRLEEATDRFESALTFCRETGYRPELAWTCVEYGDMLVRQCSAPADRARAMSLFEEGLAISTELGMPPLMERLRSKVA
jgi:tetratricopeptide (TPR) repeat protein